jgi:hypothetical protein
MTYPLMTDEHEPTELERWWASFDAQAQAHTTEALAYYRLGLTAGQAANWANVDFSAADAAAWTAAGFAPSEADMAAWYREAGHEDATTAYVASLADTTAGLVDEAEQVVERCAARQNEALIDEEYLLHGHDDIDGAAQAEEPYVETDADAAYADSWGDIQAERAQEQGERLADEAEEIAAGVEAREAELDAIEEDADMVGSDAWQECQRDLMAEGAFLDEGNPDVIGTEASDADYWHNAPTDADFDYTDADEMRAAGHPAAQADDYEPEGLRDALDADGYPASGPEPDGRGDHVLDQDASTWAPDADAEAARYQADTLEYAIGDDLVVGGVAYDSDQWQADGEGGVEPRQTFDTAGAAPFQDDGYDDADGF